MPSYFLSCSYIGTSYHGSQRQKNTPHTIEEIVYTACKIFFRTELRLIFSSRTDARVHAEENMVQLLLPSPILSLSKALFSLNALLPKDIALQNIRPVREGTHARFSALSRHYRYALYTQKNPFLFGRAYFYPYEIRPSFLQSLAESLHGTKDFSNFTKKHNDLVHYRCRIDRAVWVFEKDFFYLDLHASRFLRGMVRALVGAMLHWERKNANPAEFFRLLDPSSDTPALMIVPACGLRLMKVNYQADIYI